MIAWKEQMTEREESNISSIKDAQDRAVALLVDSNQACT